MTEKDKTEIEIMLVEVILDTLGAVKEGMDKKANGTWLLDGGLGNWLIKSGKLYDKIMNIDTLNK